MSKTKAWTIYTDGAARKNPGPAAFGYVIQRPGEHAIEEKGTLGVTTNNVAEYEGVLRALRHAQSLGGSTIRLFCDSELLVKQMKGEYKVKNPGIKKLFEQVKEVGSQFDSLTFTHIPRAQNADADRLCNEALDGVG